MSANMEKPPVAPLDLVNIEVDGKPMQARKGQMLIEVTDPAGVYIPRFCYHKKLSIAANCRMCLVEVEKAPKPLPACATPVMEGMKVFTRSEKARDAQKGTMEFLLINHPLDCPICDQGGECQLQDLSVGYGKDVSRYHEAKRIVPDKNIGPLISTDMTRCIHCTRCVRFGQEVAGVMEFGGVGRGEHMEIRTFLDRSVDSELSGNVIDYVGGLRDIDDRTLRFVGDPAERIEEDHLRMLRYLRFLQKTGFSEDPKARSAIRASAEQVLRLPAERITDELNRTFALGNVGNTLERLQDYGLLEKLLPEVANLASCKQGPPYHMEGDVFRHTVLVANGLPQSAGTELAWAAILHDIGKPETRSEEPAKDGSPAVHFLEHEHASVRDAREILAPTDDSKKRFAFSGKSAETIRNLIEKHIKIFSFADMRRGTAEAFLKETRDYWDDLYALAIADTRASHGSDPSLDANRMHNLERISERAQEIFAFWEQAKDAINEITALVNGNLIKERYAALHGIELTGRRQKIIGAIKNAAQAKIREERILDPDTARETLDAVIATFPPDAS